MYPELQLVPDLVPDLVQDLVPDLAPDLGANARHKVCVRVCAAIVAFNGKRIRKLQTTYGGLRLPKVIANGFSPLALAASGIESGRLPLALYNYFGSHVTS